MSGISTFLSSVGSRLKTFFTKVNTVIKEGDEIATKVEPVVDLATAAFPGVPALFNAVVTEVGNVETAAAAAGAQSGTGEQKLAAVLASPAVQLAVVELETTAGIPALTSAEITAFVNAVVAALNSLPATTVAA